MRHAIALNGAFFNTQRMMHQYVVKAYFLYSAGRGVCLEETCCNVQAPGAKESHMPESLSQTALHAMDAYWRAANYLSVGQIYILGNPLAGTAQAGTHQAPAAWTLGDDSGSELHLHASQPCDQGARPEHDLHLP
jgi:XFP N-terminal domain